MLGKRNLDLTSMKPNKETKQRKPLKGRFDRCPNCLLGGLRKEYPTFDTTDGRPRFHCDRCKHSFTYGKDGGEYGKVVK